MECNEKLLKSEDENRRLNGYIEQIISDIGDRAPALKRQRDEYESAVDKLKVTSDQLTQEKASHEKTKQNEEFYKKSAEDMSAENSRLQSQVLVEGNITNLNGLTWKRGFKCLRF